MHTRKILIAISILALSALFCSTSDLGLPQDVMLTVTAQVPALQTEVAQQLTQVALSPAPPASPAGLGSISGSLNYPADSLPAMRVAAFDTATGQVYTVDTVLGQDTYQIPNVPAGTYHVVAYSLGGGSFPVGLAGGYTAAVPCGMTEACTDHSLLPVAVESGNDTSNIRPADWFAPDLPAMPGLPPPPAGESPIPQNGQISGHLSYPSEFIPPLNVVAIRIGGGPSDYYSISTPQNQAEYFLSVPAGDYYILSYISGGDLAGGYTQMVPCGLSAECTDHSLIPVHVDPGAVVTGIDPGDWYAPEGSFPPNPLP